METVWQHERRMKHTENQNQQQCDRSAWGAEERSDRTFFNCAHTDFFLF